MGRMTRRLWVLGAAATLLAAHAWLFRGWLIDDAGISYAYARNLAGGHGLVSQPGVPPVEGFSNPAWVLLASILYWLGAFDEQLTPKIVGAAAGLGTILVIWYDLRPRMHAAAALAIPLMALALCSPFVIWTMSGLENGLLAVLIVLLTLVTLTSVAVGASPRRDVLAGLLAATASLTRPDAILYAPAYPLLVAAASARRQEAAAILRSGARVLAAFLPIYGGYLLFRRQYFGEWVPNTYYAKAHPSLDWINVAKIAELLESAAGDAFWVVPILLPVAAGIVIWRGADLGRLMVLFAFTGIASATFLIMPGDWMGEFRFATPFYPLFYWLLAEVGRGLVSIVPHRPLMRWGLGAAALLFLAQAATIFTARSLVFAQDPPVPLTEVKQQTATGFNRLARAAGITGGSVLTPDLGGMLLDSQLRVYDLAGLCDETIARNLSLSGDLSVLHAYIFDQVRPTFIHSSGAFQRLSRLHEDQRLQRDYVALYESWEAPPEWPTFWKGTPPPWLAYYVRRDALGSDPAALERLIATHREARLDVNVPWLRPPDRLADGFPQVRWAFRTFQRRLGSDATMASH